jgi:adenylate cyclase
MEFASVVDAVTFAVDVQRAMAERNAGVPEDSRIAYRVGINIGDVIIDGDDIYGGGVNIAARLEGLAEPGGICVAGNVFEQVKAKVDLTFEDLGEKEVKNIPEPVRVHRVVLDGGAAAAGQRGEAAPALPDMPSIAVLPFDNMSGDPEQEYFADGIAEDIITELSREPDLFVIARNSSFAYKGQSPDIRQVARELGVRYVLEGSVRKAGNRIRLNAQLVEAETNHHVWAERYDRGLEDIFEVQDELTGTIINALLHKVLQSGMERAMRRMPTDMDAYDHYLKAFGLLFRFNRESNLEAQRESEAALALDPDYARAHMVLAWAHLYAYWSVWTEDPPEALERACQAAQKAISADRNDFWGYAALGFAELSMGRHDRALSAVDRAVALSPNNADARAIRAMVLNFLGHPEEALEEMERAVRLNPHHPDWYLIGLGRIHYMLGRHEDTIPPLQRLVDNAPDLAFGRLSLAANYLAVGRLEDGRAEIAAVLEASPSLTVAQVGAIVPFARQEDLDRYLDLLRQAGLPE